MSTCSIPPLAHADEAVVTLEIPRPCGHGSAVVGFCREHSSLSTDEQKALGLQAPVCPTCLQEATSAAKAAAAGRQRQAAKDARRAAKGEPPS